MSPEIRKPCVSVATVKKLAYLTNGGRLVVAPSRSRNNCQTINFFVVAWIPKDVTAELLLHTALVCVNP